MSADQALSAVESAKVTVVVDVGSAVVQAWAVATIADGLAVVFPVIAPVAVTLTGIAASLTSIAAILAVGDNLGPFDAAGWAANAGGLKSLFFNPIIKFLGGRLVQDGLPIIQLLYNLYNDFVQLNQADSLLQDAVDAASQAADPASAAAAQLQQSYAEMIRLEKQPYLTATPLPPAPTPVPPYDPGPTVPGQPVSTEDPNYKLGPAGYGTQGFIADSGTLPYTVEFENDPSATAPAQQVVVTDQLDPSLDWKTLQFTTAGFGDNSITIPANTQYYQTAVPMTYNGQTFDVDIELELECRIGPGLRLLPVDRPEHRPAAQQPARRLPAAREWHWHRRGLFLVHDSAQHGIGHRHADSQCGPGQLRRRVRHRHGLGERRRSDPGHRSDQGMPEHHRRRSSHKQCHRAAGHGNLDELHGKLVRPGRPRRLGHRLLRRIRLRQRRHVPAVADGYHGHVGHVHGSIRPHLRFL